MLLEENCALIMLKTMQGSNNPAYGKNDHTHRLVKYAKSRKGFTNAEIYDSIKAKSISLKISQAHKGKSKPGTSKAMETTGLSRYKIKQLAKI